MKKMDKLIKFLLSTPVDASFDDVKRLLEALDFEEVRSSGSHHIFRHLDGRMQIIPKKGGKKVKQVYIKQIIKLLSLEDYEQEEQDN
jgi:predicted RNA binding protein YcfA (HicA-like mRNA interferase family)